MCSSQGEIVRVATVQQGCWAEKGEVWAQRHTWSKSGAKVVDVASTSPSPGMPGTAFEAPKAGRGSTELPTLGRGLRASTSAGQQISVVLTHTVDRAWLRLPSLDAARPQSLPWSPSPKPLLGWKIQNTFWSGLVHTDGHDKTLALCLRQEHIPKCLLHRTVVTLRAPVCWGRWGCPPRMKSHEKLQRREEPIVLKHLSGSFRAPYRCTAWPGGLAAGGTKSSAGGRQLCGFRAWPHSSAEAGGAPSGRG